MATHGTVLFRHPELLADPDGSVLFGHRLNVRLAQARTDATDPLP